MQDSVSNKEKKLLCYHCGDICKNDLIRLEDKIFCCNGCKTVYEILNNSNLCKYYDINSNPGLTPGIKNSIKFEYLDDESVKNNILNFSDGVVSTVTFNIPQMHCSSCIWLLENLYKIDEGITYSRVDFLQKKLSVKFLTDKTSLRKIAELLYSLGYEPLLNLDAIDKKEKDSHLKKLYYKVGVAGFVFGNVMLFSFPEYLGLEKSQDPFFHKLFGYLNLFLSLPVFFYSASEYYLSAFKGLRNKVINIDFPLFLGIFVLFVRSAWEIITQTGAGYSDSLTGLVFLLLSGKIFQNKTYDALSFEHSYKSYFPLSVTILKNGNETTIPVSSIKKGDRILIRNHEIIPADSVLFSGDGHIDYSFVTGESAPVEKKQGDIIFAGGRQVGTAIELEVVKDISESYLTQLWNNDIFRKDELSHIQSFSDSISKYFTVAVLILAFSSGFYWLSYSLDMAVNVFTAVLIVACPCALALSIPFTFGNIMRIFGKNKFYLKKTNVIEKLSRITSIVFDKTGTITYRGTSGIEFIGDDLSRYEFSLVKSLARQSTHPYSRKITSFLLNYDHFEVNNYSEYTGKGIEGNVSGYSVKIGSSDFIGSEFIPPSNNDNASYVYLSINGKPKGYFCIKNSLRQGIKETISSLKKDYDVYLLSGDNENEKENLKTIFKDEQNMHFRQSPENKLKFIKNLQNSGEKVLMVGDGLNDAGALKQADTGISVSEDVSGFSPACDAILEAVSFTKLYDFIKMSKTGKKIIITSFIISFFYNIAALTLALEGQLKPLIAAILMPVSSISVVLFSVIMVNYFSKKYNMD